VIPLAPSLSVKLTPLGNIERAAAGSDVKNVTIALQRRGRHVGIVGAIGRKVAPLVRVTVLYAVPPVKMPSGAELALPLLPEVICNTDVAPSTVTFPVKVLAALPTMRCAAGDPRGPPVVVPITPIEGHRSRAGLGDGESRSGNPPPNSERARRVGRHLHVCGESDSACAEGQALRPPYVQSPFHC